MVHLPSFRPSFLLALATVLAAIGAGDRAFAQYDPVTVVNYANGFPSTSGLQLNGSAILKDNAIQLTDGGLFEAGSVFTTARLGSLEFATSFDFQLTDAVSDGFAFVLQGNGPDALGSAAGGIGYGNPPGGAGPVIPDGVAIVFDLHSNEGEGGNSVRFEEEGMTMPLGSHDLTGYGLDLHSGHRFHVDIRLPFGNAPTFALTDTVTGVVANIYFPYTYVQPGHSYIGFTGATGGAGATQTILNWTYTDLLHTNSGGAPIPDLASYPNGFAGTTSLTFNGGASLAGTALQLTHGTPFEATSVFTTQPVTFPSYYNALLADFDFNLGDGNGDGFAFVIQSESPTAVGSIGGGLGYGPEMPGLAERSIAKSVAAKFDMHNNAGEGGNSTGFYLNGASPTVPSIELSTSGINLHSGHTFHANIYLTDIALEIVLTDLDEYRVFSQSLHVDSSQLQLGSTVYLGFTAGTGATPSSIQVRNFTAQKLFPWLD